MRQYSALLGAAGIGAIVGESIGGGGLLGGGLLGKGGVVRGPFFDDANEYFNNIGTTRVSGTRIISTSRPGVIPVVNPIPIGGEEYVPRGQPHGTLMYQGGVTGGYDEGLYANAVHHYSQGDGYDTNEYRPDYAPDFGSFGSPAQQPILPLQGRDNPARAALSRGSVTGLAAIPLRDRLPDFGPLPIARPGLASFDGDGYIVDDRRGVTTAQCPPATGCLEAGQMTPDMQDMYEKYKRYYNLAGGRPAVAPAAIPFFQTPSILSGVRSPAGATRIPAAYGSASNAVFDGRSRMADASVSGPLPRAASPYGASMLGAGGAARPALATRPGRDSFFGKLYDSEDSYGQAFVQANAAAPPASFQSGGSFKDGQAAYVSNASSGGRTSLSSGQQK